MVNQEPDLGWCCSPMTSAVMPEEQAGELARAFKALGDPIRLRLLNMIAADPRDEVCVCELTGAFEVAAPTVSHHLKVLREAGVIVGERRGTWIYYRAVPEMLGQLSGALAATEREHSVA